MSMKEIQEYAKNAGFTTVEETKYGAVCYK